MHRNQDTVLFSFLANKYKINVGMILFSCGLQ